MNDLFEQLGGEEPALLMYLAGELDPAEQSAIDRRLAADSTVASAFDRLRGEDERFRSALASLDAATPLPVDPAVAARNVSRIMRQRQARAAAAAPIVPAAARRGLPRWTLQVAAAAAVVVGGSLLWRTLDGDKPAGGVGKTQVAAVAPDSDSIEMAAANSLARDTENWALAGGVAMDDASMGGVFDSIPSDAETAQP